MCGSEREVKAFQSSFMRKYVFYFILHLSVCLPPRMESAAEFFTNSQLCSKYTGTSSSYVQYGLLFAFSQDSNLVANVNLETLEFFEK